MKKIVLSLCILLFSGVIKAQYFYNDRHNAICSVHTVHEEEFVFYCGGNKVAVLKNNIVFNGSGFKIGVVKEKILYDNADNVICTINGKAFYSGGKKMAIVKNDIVFDGVGNRIVTVSNISMMQIAIYIFFIAY